MWIFLPGTLYRGIRLIHITGSSERYRMANSPAVQAFLCSSRREKRPYSLVSCRISGWAWFIEQRSDYPDEHNTFNPLINKWSWTNFDKTLDFRNSKIAFASSKRICRWNIEFVSADSLMFWKSPHWNSTRRVAWLKSKRACKCFSSFVALTFVNPKFTPVIRA